MTSKEFLEHCELEAKKAKIKKLATRSKIEQKYYELRVKLFSREAEALRKLIGRNADHAAFDFSKK